MNKYIALCLRAMAMGGSAASAIAAYPAASSTFGAGAGSFILVAFGAIIYTGWHYAATADNTDRRLVAAGLASLFAVAMVYGIQTSAVINTGKVSSQAASDADALYQQQEKSRMATLEIMSAELRATSKTKFPAEYANLQQQVKDLSKATPRQASATQLAQGATQAPSLYQWGISAAFEIITLALLLMAGFFSRQPVANPVTTPLTQEKPPVAIVEIDAPETAANPMTTAANPAEMAEILLQTRQLAANDDGYITANAVVIACGCTDRQARDAIRNAVANGWVSKAGEGGATRYFYPKPTLRAVR